MIFTTKSKATLAIALVAFLFFINNQQSFSQEKRSQREAIVSARSRRFYKTQNRAKQYLSLNGNYYSDYNSKSYTFGSRYLYQSFKFIHEINFNHETEFKDLGSGKNKRYYIKSSSLYDATMSNKARIKTSKYYSVFYHRTIYDELSNFYYDMRTAVGLGRMFLNENLEVDLSAGYRDVKNYGDKVDSILSWRLNRKLTNNLNLIQRGYFFIDHSSIDNELKTSLIFRLNEKLAFEIRHGFEKRTYREKRVDVNEVNRSINIGLVFDLQ